MTKWADADTPRHAYSSPYPNDQQQNTQDQDAAADGRSRTLTYVSAKSGKTVSTTAWVKNDGGKHRRRYLSLAWRMDGKRKEFRVCVADQKTRDQNLRKAWNIVFDNNLLTEEGRRAYRDRNPSATVPAPSKPPH